MEVRGGDSSVPDSDHVAFDDLLSGGDDLDPFF